MASPAKLLTPYLLQDLAYKSLDLDMDGKPDEAIAISHQAPLIHSVPAAYHQTPVVTKFHYPAAPVVYGHNALLKYALPAPLPYPYYTIRAPWYKVW